MSKICRKRNDEVEREMMKSERENRVKTSLRKQIGVKETHTSQQTQLE